MFKPKLLQFPFDLRKKHDFTIAYNGKHGGKQLLLSLAVG